MRVPLVDLKIQYERIKDEVHAAWKDILDNSNFVMGPAVSAFETEFADYCGVSHCVGVANGGDALELCLRALDIGRGDEVIIPANTFAATAMAVLQIGATPVAVDVDEDYHLIDPECVEAAITSKTRAIIPVHLFGQLAPMAPILEIAARHDLRVIEDAAQCHGATQNGKHAGQFGDMAATSFYPGKNLGAFGDGGAVLTQNAMLAERVKRLRNYGGILKYEHLEPGRNSRLDTLQAAVLRVKLRYLDDWNCEREIIAARYTTNLKIADGIITPSVLEGNHHVWHLYVTKTPKRDGLLKDLTSGGVGVGLHYPSTITRLCPNGEYALVPRAETLANQILSLPVYPGMSLTDVDEICERIARLVNQQ